MAKKYYDKEINKRTDWGGDESTENLPVSGKSCSKYYIFGGSQCISSQNKSIQDIFSFSYSNHLIIPYTDSDDNTKGFITFSGSSLISFYVFGSGYQSTLTSCPTSITTTVYGGIYISLIHQLYQDNSSKIRCNYFFVVS